MIAMILMLALPPAMQVTTTQEYRAAYEKAFRTSFRTRSIEQCRASAKEAAAAHIDVTPICGCVTDRLLEIKSVGELQTPPPTDELQALMLTCIKEHPVVAGSTEP